MELKCYFFCTVITLIVSSNRTFMELKLYYLTLKNPYTNMF